MSDLGNKAVMAANLRRLMEKAGKDRNTLCRDLNLKYSTVSEWLNATAYPRIDKIELLANYFGVQKSDLVEKEQPQTEQYIARTPDEQKILMLARHLEKIPESQRARIVKNFEDTIDIYLDAISADRED